MYNVTNDIGCRRASGVPLGASRVRGARAMSLAFARARAPKPVISRDFALFLRFLIDRRRLIVRAGAEIACEVSRFTGGVTVSVSNCSRVFV